MIKPVENKDYDYIAMRRMTEQIREEYSFLTGFTIGRSCAGRDIEALKIGRSAEYVLITAAFHGSERLTTTVLLMFLSELCAAIQNNDTIAGFDARKAMYGRGVIFVPRVNPDGCEISLKGRAGCGAVGETIERISHGDYTHWDANLRGVDINHNFNADWEHLHQKERAMGIYGPSSTRFGGFHAESEPETLALTELCRTRRIRHVVALHTQGEVIYWNFGKQIPGRSEKMAEIMATSCGYTLDAATGISQGGGFKDWFILEFDRPGFTVELGRGENPLPEQQAAKIYEQTREMLMLSAIM